MEQVQGFVFRVQDFGSLTTTINENNHPTSIPMSKHYFLRPAAIPQNTCSALLVYSSVVIKSGFHLPRFHSFDIVCTCISLHMPLFAIVYLCICLCICHYCNSYMWPTTCVAHVFAPLLLFVRSVHYDAALLGRERGPQINVLWLAFCGFYLWAVLLALPSAVPWWCVGFGQFALSHEE